MLVSRTSPRRASKVAWRYNLPERKQGDLAGALLQGVTGHTARVSLLSSHYQLFDCCVLIGNLYSGCEERQYLLLSNISTVVVSTFLSSGKENKVSQLKGLLNIYVDSNN